MTSDASGWMAALFAEHSAAVRAFAYRRVAADDVDDVVSEVFATAWRSRAKVPEHARPWLYRTAIHVIGHSLRNQRRRAARDRRAADRPWGADSADQVADRVTLARAMDELAGADAEVLRLTYWEDLPAADVAVVLGCSPAAVRVRLHRARRRLLQVLGEPGAPPVPIIQPTGRTDHD